MLTYDHKLSLERKRHEAKHLRWRANRIDAVLNRIAEYRATGERLKAIDRFAANGRVVSLGKAMRRFSDYRHCTDAELRSIFTPQGLRAFYKARYTVHAVVNSKGVTLYQVGFKHFPDAQFTSPFVSNLYAQSELKRKLQYHDIR